MPKQVTGDGIKMPDSGWSFGGNLCNKFDKHVRKSIPWYEEGHRLILGCSDHFIRDGSIVYDLGCSTGTLCQKIFKQHQHKKKLKIIGLDQEKNMILKAKETPHRNKTIQYRHIDITKIKFSSCDMIISYYTIQFLPQKERQQLIQKIFDALNPGGAFIFFEKIQGSTSSTQDLLQSLYIDFKLESDYSPDEILGKNRSLKGILKPNTSHKNNLLLKKAGFSSIEALMRLVSFEGVIAIKE